MEPKQKIEQCYAIEDNKGALDCLKKVTQEEGPCRSRLVLFTRKGCEGCKEIRQEHKKDLKDGAIEEISISSPEGQAIALKNGLDFVPALVVLDCHDNIIEPSV
jgi:hypothetical protein